MAADACLKCNAPLERAETGRPPTYCSPACRRAAEFELRRLQRRIERLERFALDLRLMGDLDGQGRKVKRELGRAEERLRLLLTGHPEPDRVSPP
jgi:hypothetical protein